jgi:hypothetical protein
VAQVAEIVAKEEESEHVEEPNAIEAELAYIREI